jgi:broad specificity phosphatase PhoE
MTRLILIRHGETQWNLTGRYQGQADPPLNENGLEQARALPEKLRPFNLELLFTSPLKRAAQTAEVAAEVLKIPLFYDARLVEIHQGDWQTRLRSEIEALYPELFRRWESEPWQVTPPGGEHLTEVQLRVDDFLDETLVKHAGRCIGIVTHRIPIALIKLRFQDLDPDIVRSLHLPNIHVEEIDV